MLLYLKLKKSSINLPLNRQGLLQLLAECQTPHRQINSFPQQNFRFHYENSILDRL